MRRRHHRPDATADIAERLASIERRLEDLEDAVDAALSVSRLDDLERRIDELGVMAPTVDDLLQLRMHLARMQGQIEALDEPRYGGRRAAG